MLKMISDSLLTTSTSTECFQGRQSGLVIFFYKPEVWIYERKQESRKKERKHALNQENDQEKRKFYI